VVGEFRTPSWVRKDLAKEGVLGFEPKYDACGKPLPFRWKAMTAKILDATIVQMHAIANAGNPLHDGLERKGHSAVWKFAGPNEPETVTVTFYKI